MKNSKRIIYGLLLTAVAFLSANFAGRKILLNSQSLPPSFITHSATLYRIDLLPQEVCKL